MEITGMHPLRIEPQIVSLILKMLYVMSPTCNLQKQLTEGHWWYADVDLSVGVVKR